MFGMKKYFFLILFCALWLQAFAQLPNTDIFLLNLNWSKKGELKIHGNPENLTNRSGYDNQPSFLPDGETLLFTLADTTGQTDIYRLPLQTKIRQNLTQTPATSEYSALCLPGNSFFTVVRVEEDGKTQRLWQFPLSGPQAGVPALFQPHIAGVGYYYRTPQDTLALFVITEPPTLQVAGLTDSAGLVAATNIGRCLQPVARQPGSISFLLKLSNANWLIKRLTLGNLDTQTVAPALSGAEDFVWLPDGSLVMGKNSRLFRLLPKQKEWTLMADFSDLSVRNISRLAVNANGTKLVFVAEMFK